MARASRRPHRGRVHVLYLIDSLISGGAEQSLAVARAALHAPGRRARRRVSLRTRQRAGAPALEAAGARVFSVAGPGGMPGAMRRTRRLLTERRPDVLHTTLFDADIVGRCAALFTRVPVVTSLVNESYGAEQRAQPEPEGVEVARRAARRRRDGAARDARFHAVSANVATVIGAAIARAGGPHRRDPARPRPGRARRARRRRVGHARGPRSAWVTATRSFSPLGRHEYQKGFDVADRRVRDVAPRPAAAPACSSRVATATSRRACTTAVSVGRGRRTRSSFSGSAPTFPTSSARPTCSCRRRVGRARPAA